MSIRAHWPGSFLRLVWIGSLCVSLPLLVALVNAGIFAGWLASRSAEAVERASRAASNGQVLLDQVVSLERRARQLYVLGESQFLTDYAERREALRENAEGLTRLLDDPAQRDRLERLVALEEGIHEVFVTGPYPKGADVEALDQFVELNRLAREVVSESNRMSLEEADAMQKAARRTQRLLAWEASALVPLTLLLTALFAFLLSKPIRGIDEAIRRLGAGEFSSKIAVRGPRDLELLGERLDWLRSRLAELEAEKTKFLAHVSHELKTPLTAIREGAEIMGEGLVGPLPEEQGEVVAIIRDNTIRLQRLIENLLRFSLDSAKETFRPVERVDLSTVIEEVLADHKPAILSKSISLEASNPSLVWVAGDKDRLRTVVDNLVSNAIKFTPEGGAVRVSSKVDGDKTLVEVSDTGPGIPPEERERIWEPFYQGRITGNGGMRGSGLGLSIVQEYVEELGGDVHVADGPEGGGLLRVRLPLAPGEGKA